MDSENVRQLALSAHERWRELELRHRSNHEDIQATLRHGELEATLLDTDRSVRERGAPASTWTVRPLEPFPTNYMWSAMLDPHEIATGVAITEVRQEELFGRPVVAFLARALLGYDPICSCCLLLFSEASEQLEHGKEWKARPGELPDGVDMALDLEVGIVVNSRDRGGRLGGWFTNEILRAM